MYTKMSAISQMISYSNETAKNGSQQWWNPLFKTDLVVSEVVHFAFENSLPAVGDGDILHNRGEIRMERLWEMGE